jgi:GNAT superfamily N-acetyltransferase
MSAVASGSPAYEVVDGDVREHRDAFLEVCRRGREQNAHFVEKYDWFYRSCPWGEPQLRLLRVGPDGPFVGAAAIGRRPMFLDGRPVRAGVLVDLVVDAAHRSLGPALMLQREMLARALDEFDVVYGFPNPKAVRVVTRVGYSMLDEIVRCSHVLRHAPYLERVLPRPLARIGGAMIDLADRCIDTVRELARGRLAIEWRDDVDPRMQALWEKAPPTKGLVGSKEIRASQWRFAASSTQRARYLLVSRGNGEGIEAWFACHGGGSMLHVGDFWSVGANRTLSRAAILALLRAARNAGYAVVSIECTATSPMLAAWRAAGFSERGRRPVVGAWSPRFGNVEGPIAIHLTPADEDE